VRKTPWRAKEAITPSIVTYNCCADPGSASITTFKVAEQRLSLSAERRASPRSVHAAALLSSGESRSNDPGGGGSSAEAASLSAAQVTPE
jgi:hypothetical protein